MNLWDQMVTAFGHETAVALVALEIGSVLLTAASIVAAALDVRAARARRIVDERNALVEQSRRARGLS